MPDQQTNEKFVVNMMNFSKFGALSQLFILDAILKHAERVSAASPEQCDTPMVSGEAWVGVAKEIKAKFDARDGS